MGYTPYVVLALITPQADADFASVSEAIRTVYERRQIPVQIEQHDKHCILYFDAWSFRIYWEDEPHVLVESQEIAVKFPSTGIDPAVIASCAQRITTAGDSDPDMLHFNDYVYVLEVLERFKGVYLFDPNDGKYFGTGEDQK